MANRAEKIERNAATLAELLPHHEAELRRFARHHSRFAVDADDALQRAYILFIERYQEHYKPLAWLHTTVKREAWRLAKSVARRRELTLESPPPGESNPSRAFSQRIAASDSDPESRVEELLEKEEAMAAIEELKPDERSALLMLGLGYSYEEIGERRGWTQTKVNRCLSEGREAVRAKIERRAARY